MRIERIVDIRSSMRGSLLVFRVPTVPTVFILVHPPSTRATSVLAFSACDHPLGFADEERAAAPHLSAPHSSSFSPWAACWPRLPLPSHRRYRPDPNRST